MAARLSSWAKPKNATSDEAPAGVVAFLLAQVGALAATTFAERLGPLGLTPAQAGLLRAVASDPGRSQRALAKQLGTLPSRLVVLVDELESAGLLERQVSRRDRRISELHLTAAGAQTMRRIGRTAQAHGDDLLAPLSGTGPNCAGRPAPPSCPTQRPHRRRPPRLPHLANRPTNPYGSALRSAGALLLQRSAGSCCAYSPTPGQEKALPWRQFLRAETSTTLAFDFFEVDCDCTLTLRRIYSFSSGRSRR